MGAIFTGIGHCHMVNICGQGLGFSGGVRSGQAAAIPRVQA